MELRERLYQSAAWCDGADGIHERIKHIAQDLRDAAAEIETLTTWNASNAAETREQRRKVRQLEEQLLIARTSASDTDSFREREKKEYANVMVGVRLAIHALAEGLKGGQR